MPHIQILLLFLLIFCTTPALAEERTTTQQSDQTTAALPGIFSLIPADSITNHVLQGPAGGTAYTATAGTIDLSGQDGKIKAKLFYTAYTMRGAQPNRPLTFAFNGGPGAASAYLHLGLLGPKVLDFGPEGDDGSTPLLKDNPDSWLRFTDIVLIDPVGTGWSRAASSKDAEAFFGVTEDAESLAKMIALYVKRNDRISSPKFLIGESYGGFRAAKVAAALKDNQGLLISGMIMVSPLIEGRFVFGPDDDPLTNALLLPSLAAAELERKGRFEPDALVAAEDFAIRDYLVALAGPPLLDDSASSLYERIADLTGLHVKAIARTGGLISSIYAKHTGKEGKIISPYDASYVSADPYPEADYARHNDPILDGFTRAYGGAFASYASKDLGYDSELTYTMLNQDVNRSWSWGRGRNEDGRLRASAANDIRDLLSVIPTFRLMVAHGYSDAITPYGFSRYVLDHLPPMLADGRTSLNLYRGGHMFYTDPPQRRAFFDDAADFYARTTSQ